MTGHAHQEAERALEILYHRLDTFVGYRARPEDVLRRLEPAIGMLLSYLEGARSEPIDPSPWDDEVQDDDRPDIRATAKQTLRGQDALTAMTVALADVRTHGADMDGPELARHLRPQLETVAALVAGGYRELHRR